MTTDRIVITESISPWTQGHLLGHLGEADERPPSAAA